MPRVASGRVSSDNGLQRGRGFGGSGEDGGGGEVLTVNRRSGRETGTWATHLFCRWFLPSAGRQGAVRRVTGIRDQGFHATCSSLVSVPSSFRAGLRACPACLSCPASQPARSLPTTPACFFSPLHTTHQCTLVAHYWMRRGVVVILGGAPSSHHPTHTPVLGII